MLVESANFVFKLKGKHAIEEQSQCLEESKTAFPSQIGLLKLGVKINVKSIIFWTIEALQ